MNKKKLILPILAVIGLIVITISATVAFFSYAKNGSTENNIESGTINFIYEEVNRIGNGISITDALPMSDIEGKAQSNYFDFKITSTSAPTIAIPYEITARVVDGSDDIGNSVKVYLTKVNGNSEEEKVLSIFDDLDDSTNTLASKYNDKALYEDEIPAGSSNFVENYRLRMWLDSSTDFSDGTLNDKTFSIKINVYANGEQATQQKMQSAQTADLVGVNVNNVPASDVVSSSDNYDFFVEVDRADNYNLEVTALNDGETYTVEKITEQEANTLKLSTGNSIELTNGDNYFKITVTSANRQNTKIYVVKVTVSEEPGLYASDGTMIATWDELVEAGITGTSYASGRKAINAVANGQTNLRLVFSNSITSIASQSFDITPSLASVKIGNSVKNIGNSAFNRCNNLTSVTLNDGLETVGYYAFADNPGLTEITIPASVTSVSDSSFENCTNLKTVTYAPGRTSTLNLSGTNFKSVTKVILPSSITTIADNSFKGFTKLQDINIPSGVTTIGNYAFSGDTSLTNITIPEGVTTIGNYAFNSDAALTSIDLPDGLITIGEYAFNKCNGLTSITIPNNVTTIKSGAFSYCTGLTSVTLGNSVTALNYATFRGCTNLSSVTLNNGLTTIGNYIFEYDTALLNITIPSSVTKITASAFESCSNLASATFNDPTGWRSKNTNLDLSDPAQNATYLKSTYVYNDWTKSN